MTRPCREQEAYDAGRLAGFEEGLATADGVREAAEAWVRRWHGDPMIHPDSEFAQGIEALRAAIWEEPSDG